MIFPRGSPQDLQVPALGGCFDTQSESIERGGWHFSGLYCGRAYLPDEHKRKSRPSGRTRVTASGRRITRKPLVAIGGITVERAAEVFAAGADSVAVIRDLALADDVQQRARQYLAIARQVGSTRS